MVMRLVLTLLLVSAQMATPVSWEQSGCTAGAISRSPNDLDEVHRATCGESCCCPPDDCPCMESRDTHREVPAAPLAPPARSEVLSIDLILPHSLAARDALHFATATRLPVFVRAPECAGRSIHVVIGIWLT